MLINSRTNDPLPRVESYMCDCNANHLLRHRHATGGSCRMLRVRASDQSGHGRRCRRRCEVYKRLPRRIFRVRRLVQRSAVVAWGSTTAWQGTAGTAAAPFPEGRDRGFRSRDAAETWASLMQEVGFVDRADQYVCRTPLGLPFSGRLQRVVQPRNPVASKRPIRSWASRWTGSDETPPGPTGFCTSTCGIRTRRIARRNPSEIRSLACPLHSGLTRMCGHITGVFPGPHSAQEITGFGLTTRGWGGISVRDPWWRVKHGGRCGECSTDTTPACATSITTSASFSNQLATLGPRRRRRGRDLRRSRGDPRRTGHLL